MTLLNKEIEYKIKAGNHYCDKTWLYISKGSQLRFEFTPSESMRTENYPHVNKILGLSAGLNPLNNSYRIGWRCIDGKLMFVAYIHSNKETISENLCYFDLLYKIECSLVIMEDGIGLDIYNDDGETLSSSFIKCDTKLQNYYMLCLPYFGGNTQAPHDITMKIKILP